MKRHQNSYLSVKWEKIQLTLKRTEEAIKDLKNVKASGPGEIPAELLKNLTCTLIKLIRKLFEDCINREKSPTEWMKGHLMSILKK